MKVFISHSGSSLDMLFSLKMGKLINWCEDGSTHLVHLQLPWIQFMMFLVL
jgi:hypothetical protein